MIFTTCVTLNKVLNFSEANTTYYISNIHIPVPCLLSDPSSSQDGNGPNKKQLHRPTSFAVTVGYGMRFWPMTYNQKSLLHSQEYVLKDEAFFSWHVSSACSPQFLNLSNIDIWGQVILTVGAVL